MAVVINEFEVVEQAPVQRAIADEAAADQGAAAGQIEPLEVRPALQALETQALRAWAH